jgi:AraC-like DNA-binding protein
MVPNSQSSTITAQRMVDLIEKTYTERMTLDTIAAALREKPEPLGRMFQRVMGMSVHEYLTEVRLRHAAHLVSARVKIEAVALSVGYRSKKNFYRQFVRRFGVTPETYRRRQAIAGGRHASQSSARPHNGGTNGVTVTYAGTFDHTSCLIEIEVRPNVIGHNSYVATPYVVINHGMQSFASTSDHIEITGETEADAVERASVFLEHRFGERAAAAKRQLESKRVPPILSTRR